MVGHYNVVSEGLGYDHDRWHVITHAMVFEGLSCQFSSIIMWFGRGMSQIL